MPRSCRGASLAEVMLALVVVSVYSVGILTAVGKSTELNRKDQELTRAHAFCQQRMEELIRLSRENFDHPDLLPAGSPFPFQFLDTNGDGALSTPGDYLVTRHFVLAPDPANPNLRRVSVAVFYADLESAAPVNDGDRPRAGEIVRMSTMVVD